MTNRSIVIPSIRIGGPQTVAALRSLANYGVTTIVCSEEHATPASYSRYSDQSISVPNPHTDLIGYKDALVTLATRDDVHAILPIREIDVYILSKNRAEFAEHITPLWPPLEKLRIAHDRIKLFTIADELNIPIPETGILDDHEFRARRLVVKSRYGILASEYKSEILETESIVPPKQTYYSTTDLPPLSDITSKMGHRPLVQEFIDGTQYNYRAIYKDGQIHAESQMRKRRCMRFYGGAGVYCELVENPRLKELGRELLDHIGWEGLASIQFIRDEDSGEFHLLEMNPRLWSSVACDINGGVDWPRYYWDLSRTGTIQETPDAILGTPTHNIYGELTHLSSILTEDFPFDDPPSFLGSLWNVGTSLITNPRFDTLSMSDPLPFFVEALFRSAPENYWPARGIRDHTTSIPEQPPGH